MRNKLAERDFIRLLRYIALAVVMLCFFLTGCLSKKVQNQPKLADICVTERALADKATHEDIDYLVILDHKNILKNNRKTEELGMKFRTFNMNELRQLLGNFDSLVDYINCLHSAYGPKEEEYDFENKVNRTADGLRHE